MDKPSSKDKDLGKKPEAKGSKTESVSSEPESSMKDERKHWRKCICVCLFFFADHPLNFGASLHKSACSCLFVPLFRTQEPRQDGDAKFQKRRS